MSKAEQSIMATAAGCFGAIVLIIVIIAASSCKRKSKKKSESPKKDHRAVTDVCQALRIYPVTKLTYFIFSRLLVRGEVHNKTSSLWLG
ncbi:hypothetical protein D918_02637 [Trichuris suis]|nr:hypothetical protein D918_02637 [Trichuris suis]